MEGMTKEKIRGIAISSIDQTQAQKGGGKS